MERNIFSRTTRVIKFFLAPILHLLTTTTLPAEKSATSGVGVFEGAACFLTAHSDPLVDLIYIIGAVVSLTGAIKVCQKFGQGDPDTGKTVASWFGACIFFVTSVNVLKVSFIS